MIFSTKYEDRTVRGTVSKTFKNYWKMIMNGNPQITLLSIIGEPHKSLRVGPTGNDVSEPYVHYYPKAEKWL